MKNYRVVWEIDVEAETPREAAIAAMLMQDEHTTANEFTVQLHKGQHKHERHDGQRGLTSCRQCEPVEIDLGDEPRHLLITSLLETMTTAQWLRVSQRTGE